MVEREHLDGPVRATEIDSFVHRAHATLSEETHEAVTADFPSVTHSRHPMRPKSRRDSTGRPMMFS